MKFLKFVTKWFLILSVLLAILAGGLWFLFHGVQKLFHKNLIVVPNFRGLSLVEVLENRPKGLHLEIFEKKKSRLIPKGHIIEQNPKAGERVKEGRQLLVTVSLGSDHILMPNLLGKSFRKSSLILRNLGLSVGSKSYLENPNTKNALILSQSPKAGQMLERGALVSFLISKSSDQEQRVPMLEGKTLGEVRLLLNKMEIPLATVKTIYVPGYPQSQVLEQTPPAGNILKLDEKMTLIVNNRDEINENKQIKTKKVQIKLPPGLKKQLVRIELMDASGKKVIYEKDHKPQDSFTLEVDLKGRGYLNIFLNKIFYKKIELLGEEHGVDHRTDGY
ncbi:PASTA domain-containing protein [bacterium]|nr:PASTA domain-containing protein [bacterium]